MNIIIKGFDLLKKLLAIYPEQRISAKEALNHPWFGSFRDFTPLKNNVKDQEKQLSKPSFFTFGKSHLRKKSEEIDSNSERKINFQEASIQISARDNDSLDKAKILNSCFNDSEKSPKKSPGKSPLKSPKKCRFFDSKTQNKVQTMDSVK